MNAIGRRHDAVRVPLVQSAQGFTDCFPGGAVRQRVAARRDAKRNKINDVVFPRQHHGNAWRSGHKKQMVGVSQKRPTKSRAIRRSVLRLTQRL